MALWLKMFLLSQPCVLVFVLVWQPIAWLGGLLCSGLVDSANDRAATSFVLNHLNYLKTEKNYLCRDTSRMLNDLQVHVRLEMSKNLTSDINV